MRENDVKFGSILLSFEFFYNKSCYVWRPPRAGDRGRGGALVAGGGCGGGGLEKGFEGANRTVAGCSVIRGTVGWRDGLFLLG